MLPKPHGFATARVKRAWGLPPLLMLLVIMVAGMHFSMHFLWSASPPAGAPTTGLPVPDSAASCPEAPNSERREFQPVGYARGVPTRKVSTVYPSILHPQDGVCCGSQHEDFSFARTCVVRSVYVECKSWPCRAQCRQGCEREEDCEGVCLQREGGSFLSTPKQLRGAIALEFPKHDRYFLGTDGGQDSQRECDVRLEEPVAFVSLGFTPRDNLFHLMLMLLYPMLSASDQLLEKGVSVAHFVYTDIRRGESEGPFGALLRAAAPGEAYYLSDMVGKKLCMSSAMIGVTTGSWARQSVDIHRGMVPQDHYRDPMWARMRAFFASGLNIPKMPVADKKVGEGWVTLVQRRPQNRRMVHGLDEAAQALESLGIYKVRLLYMEDWRLIDQISFMLETRCLAGPHGAALTYVAFLEAGSTVLEVVPAGTDVLAHPVVCYKSLATRAGVAHEYVWSEDTCFWEGDVRACDTRLPLQSFIWRVSVAMSQCVRNAGQGAGACGNLPSQPMCWIGGAAFACLQKAVVVDDALRRQRLSRLQCIDEEQWGERGAKCSGGRMLCSAYAGPSPPCDMVATALVGKCMFQDKTYKCTDVPGYLLTHPTNPAPSRFCLGANESWGTCSKGEYLCEEKMADSRWWCANVTESDPRYGTREWLERGCEEMRAGFSLGQEAQRRIGWIRSAPVRVEGHESSESQQLRIVSSASMPTNKLLSWMDCASVATKLAHGYTIDWVVAERFDWMARMAQTGKFLATLPPETMVLVQDSTDTVSTRRLLLPDEAKSAEGYYDLVSRNDVLFNGECNCFPDTSTVCETMDTLFGKTGPYKYLNAGQYMGRASVLIQLIKGAVQVMEDKSFSPAETDQGAMQRFCYKPTSGQGGVTLGSLASQRGIRCVVDAAAEVLVGLFTCPGINDKGRLNQVHKTECSKGTRDSRKGPCYVVPSTGNFPFSLHFNGKTGTASKDVERMEPFINFSLAASRQPMLDGAAAPCINFFAEDTMTPLGCFGYDKLCGGRVEDEMTGGTRWDAQTELAFVKLRPYVEKLSKG